LHVLKKDEMIHKKQKKKEQLNNYRVESIQDRLDKKFEKMDAGKAIAKN